MWAKWVKTCINTGKVFVLTKCAFSLKPFVIVYMIMNVFCLCLYSEWLLCIQAALYRKSRWNCWLITYVGTCKHSCAKPSRLKLCSNVFWNTTDVIVVGKGESEVRRWSEVPTPHKFRLDINCCGLLVFKYVSCQGYQRTAVAVSPLGECISLLTVQFVNSN